MLRSLFRVQSLYELCCLLQVPRYIAGLADGEAVSLAISDAELAGSSLLVAAI